MANKTRRQKPSNTQRTRSKTRTKRHLTTRTRTRTRIKRHSKEYFTIHNGDKPYKVSIRNTDAFIHRYPDEFRYDKIPKSKDYTIPVASYSNLKKVFVGKSIRGDDMYGSYPNNPSKASKMGLGNSILLQKDTNQYVFIGHRVVEFTTTSPILEYYSMIGRNDVPYPLAISNTDVYIMLPEGTIQQTRSITKIPKKEFKDFPSTHSWALDGYSRYYRHGIFKDMKNLQSLQKSVPTKLIHE